MIALAAALVLSGGCHTDACHERVWNRAHPFRPALASWYDAEALGGRLGCAPYRYRRGELIVAHKTLPCGTRLRICFRRCVTARVKDRGPYSGAREYDLDRGVRDATGFDGVATIRVRRLAP